MEQRSFRFAFKLPNGLPDNVRLGFNGVVYELDGRVTSEKKSLFGNDTIKKMNLIRVPLFVGDLQAPISQFIQVISIYVLYVLYKK